MGQGSGCPTDLGLRQGLTEPRPGGSDATERRTSFTQAPTPLRSRFGFRYIATSIPFLSRALSDSVSGSGESVAVFCELLIKWPFVDPVKSPVHQEKL